MSSLNQATEMKLETLNTQNQPRRCCEFKRDLLALGLVCRPANEIRVAARSVIRIHVETATVHRRGGQLRPAV